MSVKTVFAALAFATVAGAAAAQAISPGMVQMSNQLGVVPGTLTLAELSQLANAKRENDAEAIRFITSGAAGLSKSTMNAAGSSAGADQLAAIAGVAPGQYTPNELIRLHQAQIDGDRETAKHILSGANRVTADPASTNAGKAQIAAILGVNAADYSLAQLTAMLPQSDS